LGHRGCGAILGLDTGSGIARVGPSSDRAGYFSRPAVKPSLPGSAPIPTSPRFSGQCTRRQSWSPAWSPRPTSSFSGRAGGRAACKRDPFTAHRSQSRMPFSLWPKNGQPPAQKASLSPPPIRAMASARPARNAPRRRRCAPSRLYGVGQGGGRTRPILDSGKRRHFPLGRQGAPGEVARLPPGVATRERPVTGPERGRRGRGAARPAHRGPELEDRLGQAGGGGSAASRRVSRRNASGCGSMALHGGWRRGPAQPRAVQPPRLQARARGKRLKTR